MSRIGIIGAGAFGTALACVEAREGREVILYARHSAEAMARNRHSPRLPGVAELGWSIASARKWDDYRHRLAAHEKRWKILGVNYHRSGLSPWTVGDG